MQIEQYGSELPEKLLKYFCVRAQKVRWKVEKYADGGVKARTPTVSACEYPTFEAFAERLGVGPQTLSRWEAEHPEFADACERARQQQKRIIVENALAGYFNSSFAQFMLLNRFGGEYRARPAGETVSGLDVNVVYGRGDGQA